MRHVKKLLLIAAAALAIILGISVNHAQQQERQRSSEQLAAGALLLDVRTPAEYRAGHIQGAINIPVQELPQRLAELNDWRARDMLIYCHSGGRSRQATTILQDAGFTKLRDVGAMSNLRP